MSVTALRAHFATIGRNFNRLCVRAGLDGVTSLEDPNAGRSFERNLVRMLVRARGPLEAGPRRAFRGLLEVTEEFAETQRYGDPQRQAELIFCELTSDPRFEGREGSGPPPSLTYPDA